MWILLVPNMYQDISISNEAQKIMKVQTENVSYNEDFQL